MFSSFILGTVQLGMQYGLGQWKNETMPEEVAFSILNKAWEYGFNTLDTSPNYGKANFRIKKFMKLYPEKKFHIILKIKNISQRDNTFKSLLKTIKEENFFELEACQTLTVLLHNENDIYNNLITDQLNDLLRKGHINDWGISIYSSKVIERVIEFPECKIIQLPFSVLNQSMFNNGTIEKLNKLNKIILARSIFTQGLLFEKNLENKNLVKEVNNTINYLLNYSHSINQSLSQIASRFILSFEEINSIVIGFDNVQQIKDFHLIEHSRLEKNNISKIINLGKLIPKNSVSPEKW